MDCARLLNGWKAKEQKNETENITEGSLEEHNEEQRSEQSSTTCLEENKEDC